MDLPTAGKASNTPFSLRYKANNEELEEVFDEDPPTPQTDASPTANSDIGAIKKVDKAPSILDKYFKSIRTEKSDREETKTHSDLPKSKDEEKSSTQKEVNSSPMKDYLNRLGKRGKDSESTAASEKDGANETWKIFHDFKFKIAQAVEEIKSQRSDDKEKSLPRDSSVSDSEENSMIRDLDQQSVGDTDNQVSSLDSSIQNLSDPTQADTAKVSAAGGSPASRRRNMSESSDDTQKNFPLNENASKDSYEEEILLEVESGVEAFEESPAAPPAAPPPRTDAVPRHLTSPLLPTASKPSKTSTSTIDPPTYFLSFSMMFYTVVLLASCWLVPHRVMWNGFVLGVWSLRLGGALRAWLAERLCEGDSESARRFRLGRESSAPLTYTIPSVEEHRPMKKYEGWINQYRYEEYDPYVYNINQTTTAFMKLEGCNLRISYTQTKISKKAFWDEQIENVLFYQHRLYNLTGARVILLPKGLVQKRQWSKKYPICVILNSKDRVKVLEKEAAAAAERREAEGAEAAAAAPAPSAAPPDATKPRRKFVWRRKDSKDSPETPSLRQRIRSRMHKDKKTEDASTGTEPIGIVPEKTVLFEDEFIESILETATKTKDESNLEEDIGAEQYREFQRIKEFLEEAEDLDAGVSTEGKEGVEGGAEWSLHVRETRDMHTHLYIFARTSRDKHEWYRRMRTAIFEAGGGGGGGGGGGAATPTDADDDGSDAPKDSDMAVFRLADKDSIAYGKLSSSAFDVAPEPVAVSWADETLRSMDLRAHERDFWPYMYKIFQVHKKGVPARTSEENIIQDCVKGTKDSSKGLKESAKNNKGKKKERKSFGSYQQPSRSSLSMEPEATPPLPVEIGWLNAVIGRIAYDAMRNPAVVARLQRRIQRKLNTLKLPTFMGRLVATELSLGTTAPLVAMVGGPECDERGVWLTADVRYEGGAYITLNTQLNLMVFKEKKIPLEEHLERLNELDNDFDTLHSSISFHHTQHSPQPTPHPKKPAIYDSEVDDSAESSSDEESAAAAAAAPVVLDDKSLPQPVPDALSSESGSSAKKFLRMVDKITTNRYFQQVTDYKYVKRAMEGLSNTDIKLHLELKGLEGQLAVNLPPPPHDRIWIGFRSNPRLWLKARPALGQRAVRITHVTNWIEQKLCKEFEKVLVLPNMEDLLVDLMTPTPVDYE